MYDSISHFLLAPPPSRSYFGLIANVMEYKGMESKNACWEARKAPESHFLLAPRKKKHLIS